MRTVIFALKRRRDGFGIPIPGLSALFSLTDFLDEAVDDIIDNGIDAMVEPGLADVNRTIDGVVAELAY